MTMYVASGVGAIGGIATPCLKSLVAQLVDKEEVRGKYLHS